MKDIIEGATEVLALVGMLVCGTVLVCKGHGGFEAPLIGLFMVTAARGVRAAIGGAAPKGGD